MARKSCLTTLISQRFLLDSFVFSLPSIQYGLRCRVLYRSIPSSVNMSTYLAARLVPFENSSQRPESKTFSALFTIIVAAFSFAGFGLLHDCPARCDTPREVDGRDSKSPTASVSLLTDAYRRRVFFKYERKLRTMSPPEKVFEYFASIRTSEGQSFMTASDLLRAVVPVFPPSESPHVREGSLPGERPPGELRCPSSQFFMLFDTNGDGFISFSEYIFFLTLLSIPESNLSTAVKMFDLDGNGTIDRDEFKKVMAVMRSHTRQGTFQCDGIRPGLKLEKSVEDGGLVEFFFGKDGEKLLRHMDLELFLKELHEEIIRLEFSHYDYCGQGSITAKDFALSMVAAANLSYINHYLDRVDALGKEPYFKTFRLSFEEFHNFAELRKQLQPLAFAISSYGKTYGLLTKSDFQRAASQVHLQDGFLEKSEHLVGWACTCSEFHVYPIHKTCKFNTNRKHMEVRQLDWKWKPRDF